MDPLLSVGPSSLCFALPASLSLSKSDCIMCQVVDIAVADEVPRLGSRR